VHPEAAAASRAYCLPYSSNAISAADAGISMTFSRRSSAFVRAQGSCFDCSFFFVGAAPEPDLDCNEDDDEGEGGTGADDDEPGLGVVSFLILGLGEGRSGGRREASSAMASALFGCNLSTARRSVTV